MNGAARIIGVLTKTAHNGIEVEAVKVIKMRAMQAEAFRVLMGVLFRMINAPTGSGKSAEICFLAARGLLMTLRTIHALHHFRNAHRASPELRIATMLSTVTAKLGPAQKVRAWNLPLERTCCADGTDVSPVATPVCRAVCYGNRMKDREKTTLRRARLNFQIATLDDFATLMIGAVTESNADFLRIHSIGEFFSERYIRDVEEVVTTCQNVSFWAYTRAWRNPALIPSLTILATLPNIRLWLSADNYSKCVPEIPNTRIGWLAQHDADLPPDKAKLVFRAALDRDRLPMPVLGSAIVCPHEDGRANSQAITCTACRICLPSVHEHGPRGKSSCFLRGRPTHDQGDKEAAVN